MHHRFALLAQFDRNLRHQFPSDRLAGIRTRDQPVATRILLRNPDQIILFPIRTDLSSRLSARPCPRGMASNLTLPKGNSLRDKARGWSIRLDDWVRLGLLPGLSHDQPAGHKKVSG